MEFMFFNAFFELRPPVWVRDAVSWQRPVHHRLKDSTGVAPTPSNYYYYYHDYDVYDHYDYDYDYDYDHDHYYDDDGEHGYYCGGKYD